MSSGGFRAPCTYLVVRACADTRAHRHAGAGGSEGARARVDRAAQVRMSGGRAHRGPAESGSQTVLPLPSCVDDWPAVGGGAVTPVPPSPPPHVGSFDLGLGLLGARRDNKGLDMQREAQF